MISSFASPSSSSSSSSSSSVVVRVDKATSEFLIAPDWTLNIDICDTINSNNWLAKDVVKTLKKRLQHKNPRVQLLSLTLLETMVKNCGENVHFQIAERNILQDMVKIVKKKTDMNVRDKILVLLDSWQEAFGGPGGKYTQYYWAYEELRRSGVQFPQRSRDTVPIFTPPATHAGPRLPQPGYGMPSNSSTRLDEAMAAEVENLSLSTISSMKDVLDLLADMLQAVNPGDSAAVKDEVIVDLVDRCRSNQKKLMQMLTTTGDENLLAQGLELNDSLQSVLAKHDALASGTVFPNPVSAINRPSIEMHSPSQKIAEGSGAAPDTKPSAPVATTPSCLDEEEDEEDDFTQLARRHSKSHSVAPQMNEGVASVSTASTDPATSSALVLRDPVKNTKEQDIIELLSITLSDVSPHEPQTPAQNVNPRSVSPPTNQENSHSSESYTGYPGQTFNNYVAPWAQPQPQLQQQQMPQSVSEPQLQAHRQPQYQVQPQPQSNGQLQYQPQPNGQFQYQMRPQPQPQFPQYSAYPPPPWSATPGYFSNPNPSSRPPYMHSTLPVTGSMPTPVKQVNSFPAINGGARTTLNPPAAAQKTFIPSYRLFEDLNVFGNEDQKLKTTSNSSAGMSGENNQSWISGHK